MDIFDIKTNLIINKKYILYKKKLKKGREDKSPVPSFLEFSGKELLS
jgi:hypothetical protein